VNGIHDCGGVDGLGRIARESAEPVFHAEWERRVFALLWALGFNGFWNLDEFRHAIERMPAIEYLQTSYYEHWLHAMETLLVEKHIASADDLSAARGRAAPRGHMSQSGAPMNTPAVVHLIANGFPSKILDGGAAGFKVGDRIRTRNINPSGHTRLPRYARGRQGVIERDYGVFPFPDRNAHGGSAAEHVYLVRFSAQEVWGAEASTRDSLRLDLWEPHMEAGG
jgi:nitrile hydratase